MILGWAKNGIPLHIKTESGHTCFYLNREDFDPLFKDTETPQDDVIHIGDKSDIIKIFTQLTQAGLIPSEAAPAALILQGIANSWPGTSTFDAGLYLKTK